MDVKLHVGDVTDVLKQYPDNYFDGCLTDPPYGLGTPPPIEDVLRKWLAGERYEAKGGGFMGKSWDAFIPGPEIWKEVKRVLKPGASVLSFAGTRTYDLMGVSIRMAGFEYRETVMYMYGSGFPKSLDISKALDKAAGAEREVVSTRIKKAGDITGGNFKRDGSYPDIELAVTAPATDEAKRWEGYGTSLKPAYEPVILACVPLEGTYAANALKYGVAGLNIDGSRVPTTPDKPGSTPPSRVGGRRGSMAGAMDRVDYDNSKGRWPSNVILDDVAAAILDRENDETSSGAMKRVVGAYDGVSNTTLLRGFSGPQNQHGDSGGVSRFFYTSKVSEAERNDGLPPSLKNNHPTLKPADLTSYLAKLILPPKRKEPRRILVPFCGTGSEIKGAWRAGWDEAVGIDLDEQYVTWAKYRIEAEGVFITVEIV